MRESIGHFSLWGDFDPDEITATLNLQPSCVYPKGTRFEGADFPAKTATWDLYCPEDLSVRDQVQYLIEILWPHADALRPLAESHIAEFNISSEGSEVMELKSGMLQKMAQLHVNLNCFITEGLDHAD